MIAVLAALRGPNCLLQPQLWAEDGSVFLKEARELGWKALIKPYAGYLLLIPRIISASGNLVPLTKVPLFFNCCALLTLVGTAAFCHYARVQVEYKFMFPFALVLVPHGGEVFLNITNIQWITACVLVLLVAQRPAETRAQAFFDLSMLFVCGLTGPFITFFLPLFVVRLVRFGRTRYEIAMVAQASILACLQMYFILSLDPADAATHRHDVVSEFTWTRVSAEAAHFVDFLLAFLMGLRPESFLLPLARYLMVPLLLVMLTGAAVFWRGEKGFLIRTFLAAGLILYVAAVWRLQNHPILTVHPFSAQRFSYVPYVVLTFTLIAFLSETSCLRICALLMLTLSLISSLGHFAKFGMVDFSWHEHAQRVENGDQVCIPINPPGWFVELGPQPLSGEFAERKRFGNFSSEKQKATLIGLMNRYQRLCDDNTYSQDDWSDLFRWQAALRAYLPIARFDAQWAEVSRLIQATLDWKQDTNHVGRGNHR